MTLEFLQRKGFEVHVLRVAKNPQKLYEVRLSKGTKWVSIRCNKEGLTQSIEVIYHELYYKFGDLLEAENRAKSS